MAVKPVSPFPDCNPLCAKCVRHCRQPASVLLLECPRFKAFPFKIAKHRYEQLELFGSES